MERKILKVGTRGSPLALIQAEMVCDKLSKTFDYLDLQVVPIKTTGDKIQDRTLAKIGGKGLFTKEIEEALLRGDIDIAVHSMKDMPTVYPDGLDIPCVLEREDPRDALVYKGKTTLNDLPPGTQIGTSSLRRSAQILHKRPDLKVVPLRGNVQTRLRKIEEGEADATILAYAGIKRLGIKHVASYTFSVDEMIPAVSQGAIGIECRKEDAAILSLLKQINHHETFICLQAERAFLQILDGSCQTPIGGYAEIKDGQLHLRGFVSQPEGLQAHTDEIKGDISQAEALGVELGTRVLAHVGSDFFKENVG